MGGVQPPPTHSLPIPAPDPLAFRSLFFLEQNAALLGGGRARLPFGWQSLGGGGRALERSGGQLGPLNAWTLQFLGEVPIFSPGLSSPKVPL